MAIVILPIEEAKSIYEQLVSSLFVDEGILLLSSNAIASQLDTVFESVLDKYEQQDTDELSDDELLIYNLITILINRYPSIELIVNIYLMDDNGNVLVHTEELN